LILIRSLRIFVIEFSKNTLKIHSIGAVMKQLPVIALLVIIAASFMVTGFQCGSTEMTSAKLYIQRSDWPSAEKALTTEVEKNPTNAEAWYFLGYARLQLKEFKESLDALNHSLQAGPEYASKVSDAKHYGWQQTLNDGVSKYNASIPDSIPKEAKAALRQQAIDSYNLAIEFEPDSDVTYHRMAVAQMAQNNFDEEIAYLKKALDHKKDPEYFRMIIIAYTQKGEDAEAKGSKQDATTSYTNAIAELIEARKLDPNNEDLLRTMIDLYIRVGKAEEAKPAMREAIAKDPNNKVYLYDLGVLLMNSDSLKESIQNFDAALAVDDKYEEALRNRAVAYMKLGQKMKDIVDASVDAKNKDKEVDKSYVEFFKQAAKSLERLTELKPNDPTLWDALATAYGNSGMYKEATKAIEKADALKKK